jgi:hypothetical protein
MPWQALLLELARDINLVKKLLAAVTIASTLVAVARVVDISPHGDANHCLTARLIDVLVNILIGTIAVNRDEAVRDVAASASVSASVSASMMTTAVSADNAIQLILGQALTSGIGWQQGQLFCTQAITIVAIFPGANDLLMTHVLKSPFESVPNPPRRGTGNKRRE